MFKKLWKKIQWKISSDKWDMEVYLDRVIDKRLPDLVDKKVKEIIYQDWQNNEHKKYIDAVLNKLRIEILNIEMTYDAKVLDSLNMRMRCIEQVVYSTKYPVQNIYEFVEHKLKERENEQFQTWNIK